MRKIYVLPNLFTTASLFCGLFAILNVFNVAEAGELESYRYELSCWLILAAAVLDFFDGWVARMTQTESAFGVQYDSLSDLVAFGVAPAVLIYTRLIEMENRNAAEVIAAIYVVCGALRLARFNVQKSRIEKLSFTGLPIPAAAGVVVSGFLFLQIIDPEWNHELVLRILPVIMIVVSYLMVSTIPYPSLKNLRLERRRQFEVLPLIMVMLAIIYLLKNYLYALIFCGFAGYVGWGIVMHLLNLGKRDAKASHTSETEPR
ncbi:MAG: CDP-diacylglycerol--serine O-phosphatidyltransferase [Candidatus Hydrogenedentota bacterium]|jgi:CDP-diacylglycerol--serine O-phosphatidyltransferase|uniref:CDP-diacylglycerol--serine O-phosphatidyltransferase n=1 Tax=Sumerlaea chitinivorans TaxID=2250252 RepID=A0A2Z4Y2Z3_SUMC1|nr:CDP-diacylglycerol--serine O-phosphatidyltransferase [Candidatus Sumerlaea chitinivorans]RMH24111.1 MAG: CDP-diacylglycerol--serine O-phosphatidyltransferase [Candidatus Hydrogenedentota bacterium]